MSDLEERVWNLFQRPGAGPTREELRQALQTTRKPESEGAAFTLSPNEKCPFCMDNDLERVEPHSSSNPDIICSRCHILIVPTK